MATEYFLVINGIAGDYSDKALTGAFQVSSFDLPTLAAGTVNFDPLKLSLNSETMAGLVSAAALDTKISNVSLVGRTTIGGVSKITYSLNLSDVIVTDVSENNSGQGFGLTLDY